MPDDSCGEATSQGPAVSADGIRRAVPLRYPVLLLDRVVNQAPGICVAIKNLTLNEPCFSGHFPERAIYPGSMLMESMAQAGYFMGREDSSGEPPTFEESFLLSAEIKFLKPAVPGDQIIITARLILMSGETIRYAADAHVQGVLIARAMFVALLRSA